MGGTDPRAAMVEQHFVDVYRAVDGPLMRRLPHGDVVAFTSGLPLPFANGAVSPRFAPGAEVERTHAVLDELFATGLPFQWWMGPLSSSAPVTEVVADRGLVSHGPTPGMHRSLSDWVAPEPPAGVEVRRCATPAQWLAANEVFADAFGFPVEYAPAIVDLWQAVDGAVQLVVAVDGELVGCAAGVSLDGVMGLYNVGVVPAARRRGVGRAVTAALLEHGARAGCHSAILHSSEMGFPVYTALGFAHVTDVHQHVWLTPTEPAEGAESAEGAEGADRPRS